MTNKEQFLMEHNKSAPANLQADLGLLDQFREAKKSLFKKTNWSIDKLRRPFIIWLISLQVIKEKKDSQLNADKKVTKLQSKIKSGFGEPVKAQFASKNKAKAESTFHIYPYEES